MLPVDITGIGLPAEVLPSEGKSQSVPSLRFRRAFSVVLCFRKIANRLRWDAEDESHPYCEEDGACPFLEWIEQLSVKAQAKCLLRVERLRELGHELRRPEADLLRDGIYELRASLQGRPLQGSLFLPRCDCGGCGSWNRERGRRAAKGNRPRH